MTRLPHMCNHPLVCLPGAMDGRNEKGARRKGARWEQGCASEMHRFCRSHRGTWLWHTWECFTMLPALSWYGLQLSLWCSKCCQRNLRAMFVSGEWFYPPPYGQAGHNFFRVLLPFSLTGQGCWLDRHQGWFPLPELCRVVRLLRGTSREELLVLPPIWSICQRKATQGCWCDWAGWEHGCWAGLSQRCGKCCFHTLLCLIYIRIDKRRHL